MVIGLDGHGDGEIHARQKALTLQVSVLWVTPSDPCVTRLADEYWRGQGNHAHDGRTWLPCVAQEVAQQPATAPVVWYRAPQPAIAPNLVLPVISDQLQARTNSVGVNIDPAHQMSQYARFYTL